MYTRKYLVNMKLTRIIFLLLSLVCLMSCNPMAPKNTKVISAIKTLILKKLGMDNPPSAQTKLPSNAAIQHSLRIWRNNTVQEDKAVDKAITTLQATSIHGLNSFKFDFDQDEFFQQNYTITSATLTFSPSKELSNFNDIEITRGKKRKIPIHQDLNSPYLEIDILKDITRWTKRSNSRKIYNIIIKCGLDVNIPCISTDTKPFINLVYEKLLRTRKRKDIDCKNGKSGCCRQSVHVTIKDLGWDNWFFGPLEFDYHYCLGSCKNKNNSFYDEIVSDLANPTSCCIPTELTGLRALYLSENLIKDKYLHNMMAVDCSCGGLEVV